MSPPSRRRLHRQATNTTPSSSSSRTESPRFTKEQESQYGVIKMKKSSARLNPNRNSASLQTSTLQEDLIKLIGKDFEHAGKTINSKLKVSYFLTFPPLGRSLRHILDKVPKWHFRSTSNKGIWSKKISNFMQELKSAILAMFLNGLVWLCPVSVALKNP